MNRRTYLPFTARLLAGATVVLVSAAAGQTTPPPLPEATPVASPAPGVWPTPELIDGLVRRVAADVAAEYDLSEAQQAAVEQQMVTRWSSFLEGNRRELEPLVTEYLEARFAIHPPTADQVAEWAARAMPVYNRLRQNIESAEGEMRTLLDDAQRARFDAATAERRGQLNAVEGQLKRWSVGKFNEAEWWVPPAQRAPAATADRTGPAAPSPSPDPASDLPPRLAEEFSAWQRYVQEFCDRFALDRAQRNAADSILRELTARAIDHAQRHRERIAALEERINTGAGEPDAAFDRELVELYGPIDRMFAELAGRIDKLPTEGQRRQVEAAQTPKP